MTSPKTVRILLVEDNHGDVLLTRRALQLSGLIHALSVATSGEEALAMLRQEGEHSVQPRPDVVLMDINLPKMSGKDTLRVIKAEPALAAIPVVMVSSSNAERDINKSYDAQACAYLVKPLDTQKLQLLAQKIKDHVPHFVVPPTDNSEINQWV